MRTRIAPRQSEATSKPPRRTIPRRTAPAETVLANPDGLTPEQRLALARHLEDAVSTLLASGYGGRTVVRTIKSQPEFLSIEPEVIWQSINRITEEWESMYEEEARKERPRQIARLRNDLARMRAMDRPSFQSIARHEEILGRILGTFAPQRLEVDVFTNMRQSLAAVIVDLTPETSDAMVAEQLELEARAKLETPQAAE